MPSPWVNPPGAKITNKRVGLHMGTDVDVDREVRMSLDLFNTGVHVIGPPGSGKSRLLLWLFQRFCRVPNAMVILMNPKGELGRQARDWTIANGLTKRLTWFSPGDPGPVLGWNPLCPNGLPEATHAKAVREGLLAAWGQHGLDQTAQLARYLFLALACARHLQLTLAEAMRLLEPGSELRRSVLPKISDPYLRSALAYLDARKAERQDQLVASTLARLESFIMDPVTRSILTQSGETFNVGAANQEKQIVIANLEHYKPLRADDVRLLGRLFINDVLGHTFAVPKERRRRVFLIVDEVHTMATEDLCVGLELGREIGLHSVLAHQYMAQLDDERAGRLRHSLINCARTRVIFGGVSVEELEPLVKETSLGQYDPYMIKDELTSLECEPVEKRVEVIAETTNWGTTTGKSRGTSRSQSRGSSSTTTESESESHSSSFGTSESTGSTRSKGPDGEITTGTTESSGTSDGESHSSSRSSVFSDGWNESKSEGTNQSESESQSEGGSRTRTWQPVTGFIKRRVVSSRTYLSQDEFLTMELKRVKALPQAHFMLKTPNNPPHIVRGPWVKDPAIGVLQRERGLGRVYGRPYYAYPEAIAIEERARLSALIDDSEPQIEIETLPPRRRRRRIPPTTHTKKAV